MEGTLNRIYSYGFSISSLVRRFQDVYEAWYLEFALWPILCHILCQAFSGNPERLLQLSSGLSLSSKP